MFYNTEMSYTYYLYSVCRFHSDLLYIKKKKTVHGNTSKTMVLDSQETAAEFPSQLLCCPVEGTAVFLLSVSLETACLCLHLCMPIAHSNASELTNRTGNLKKAAEILQSPLKYCDSWFGLRTLPQREQKQIHLLLTI